LSLARFVRTWDSFRCRRTPRAAELAGLDAGQVLAGAIFERDLTRGLRPRRRHRRDDGRSHGTDRGACPGQLSPLGGERPGPGLRQPGHSAGLAAARRCDRRSRELSGYAHPEDPIGPEPAVAAPDLRVDTSSIYLSYQPPDDPFYADKYGFSRFKLDETSYSVTSLK
jgi:hypothetical protein